jgi:hypothetical protein
VIEVGLALEPGEVWLVVVVCVVDVVALGAPDWGKLLSVVLVCATTHAAVSNKIAEISATLLMRDLLCFWFRRERRCI